MPITPGSATKMNPMIGLSTTLNLTEADIADSVKMAKVLPRGIFVYFPNGNMAITDGARALSALPIIIDQMLSETEKLTLLHTFSGPNETYKAVEGGFLVLGADGKLAPTELPAEVWDATAGKFLVSALPDSVRDGISIVSDYAGLSATTTEQKRGLVLVIDASGDPTVDKGAALYQWVSDTNQFLKISEVESLDIDIAALRPNYQNVQAAGAVMYDHTIMLTPPSLSELLSLMEASLSDPAVTGETASYMELVGSGGHFIFRIENESQVVAYWNTNGGQDATFIVGGKPAFKLILGPSIEGMKYFHATGQGAISGDKITWTEISIGNGESAIANVDGTSISNIDGILSAISTAVPVANTLVRTDNNGKISSDFFKNTGVFSGMQSKYLVPTGTTWSSSPEKQITVAELPKSVTAKSSYKLPSPFGLTPAIAIGYIKNPTTGVWSIADVVYGSSSGNTIGLTACCPGDGFIYVTTGNYLQSDLPGSSSPNSPTNNIASAEVIISLYCQQTEIVATKVVGSRQKFLVAEGTAWNRSSTEDTIILSDMPLTFAGGTQQARKFISPFGNKPAKIESWVYFSGQWRKEHMYYSNGNYYGHIAACPGDGYIYFNASERPQSQDSVTSLDNCPTGTTGIIGNTYAQYQLCLVATVDESVDLPTVRAKDIAELGTLGNTVTDLNNLIPVGTLASPITVDWYPPSNGFVTISKAVGNTSAIGALRMNINGNNIGLCRVNENADPQVASAFVLKGQKYTAFRNSSGISFSFVPVAYDETPLVISDKAADISGSSSGYATKMEIAEDLHLTATGPTILAISAKVPGLKIFLPDPSAFPKNGIAFTIANYGVMGIDIYDYNNHKLSSQKPGNNQCTAQIFTIADKANGIWLITDQGNAEVMGRITDAGFSLTAGTATIFESAGASYLGLTSISSTQYVATYIDEGNGSVPTAVLLTVSGSAITVGTPIVIRNIGAYFVSACKLGDGRVFVAYRDCGVRAPATPTTQTGMMSVLSISGTTLKVDTTQTFSASNTSNISIGILTGNTILMAYKDEGISKFGTLQLISVANLGTTITIGTKTVFTTVAVTWTALAVLTPTQAVVTFANANGVNAYANAAIVTIDGTTLTVGPQITYSTGITGCFSIARLSDTVGIVVFRDLAMKGHGLAMMFAINEDGVLIFGKPYDFTDANSMAYAIAVMSAKKIFVTYSEYPLVKGKSVVLSIDGLSITGSPISSIFDTDITLSSNTMNGVFPCVPISDTAILSAYHDDGFGRYGIAKILTQI